MAQGVHHDHTIPGSRREEVDLRICIGEDLLQVAFILEEGGHQTTSMEEDLQVGTCQVEGHRGQTC
jgi:hypothetical protein